MSIDIVDGAKTNLLFAGLPETGKTTYLALLYLAISGDRTAILRLGGYSDDREYANRMAEKLLACEEITHTEVAEQGQLRLSLEIGDKRRQVVLEIPDLSGETWEEAVYERMWPRSLEESARTATGTLIFVHEQEFDSAPSIAEARSAARALGENDGQDTSADADEGEDKRPLPTQVQIVDLLQLLCEERSDHPARAGIVLSAWDLAGGAMTPLEWLAMNAPLVDQYLRANEAWLEATVWGVSAQGGNFKDPAERAALLAQDAIDRARVHDANGKRCPIDTPVLWIMGESP